MTFLESRAKALESVLAGGRRLWVVSLPVLVAGVLSCEPDEPELLRPGPEPAAQLVEVDRAALVEFYHATGGDDWKKNDGWLTDDSIGTWYGVTVRDGRVIHLSLPSNKLKGRLPKVVADLSKLVSLKLDGNRLLGEIPPEFGDLSDLERLDLSSNQLSGPLPSELKGLSNLEWFRVFHAGLEGPLPAWLGDLTALEELALEGNYFDSPIPPELGDLPNLWGIYLAQNQLWGPIPPELGNLEKLLILSLSENGLRGSIPPELGNLGRLRQLGLWENNLSGSIPVELGNLKSLRWLELAENHLTGPIPETLGNLVNATYVWLEENELSGALPPEMGRLSKLEKLFLSGNALEGGIPPEWGVLDSLNELYLAGNSKLSGAVPQELTQIRLGALDIDGTDLCVPPDSVFEKWLKGMWREHTRPCGQGDLGAYLVQATQSRNGAVPLVAGRRAVVRAFVTAADTVERFPGVEVRFYRNGAEVHVLDIPGKPGPVPNEVYEGDPTKSANALVPGWVIRPGLEMVVEVDPDGEVDDSVEMTRRIPEQGRIEVDVREMPTLQLTVVPWVLPKDSAEVILDLTRGLSWESEVFREMKTWLPVAEASLTVHEPVYSNSNSGFAALAAVRALRVMEGGYGYYMALSAQNTEVAGVAYRPGWASWSVFDGDVMAHELGHNMSLGHAPCGTAGDRRYPHGGGTVGTFGLDLQLGLEALVGPREPDFMSYCGPPWVSDWHFYNMVRHRLRREDAGGGSEPYSKALLIWGGRDGEGGLHLNPAFWVDAPDSPPPSGGDYEVTGWSASGERLFAVRFDMTEIEDEHEGGRAGFAIALPARVEWPEALAEISLRDDAAGRAVLHRDTDRPSVILRDGATGQVRALFIDDPEAAEAASRHPGLVAVRSRGLPDPADWQALGADTAKVKYVVVKPEADTVSAWDTVRFTATALDADSVEVEDVEFEWASRDTLVAVVDSSGLSTGQRRGRTVVRASVGEVSGASRVLVEQRVARVVVKPEADTVSAGDTVRFTAAALDARDSTVAGVEFEWSTSDTAVAWVDRSGLAFGWSEGSATIKALTGRGMSDSVEVTVEGEDLSAERLALSRIYARLGGKDWPKSRNWLTEAPLKDWHGVSVRSGSGRVAALDLSRNGLRGQLGPELGELADLGELSLSGNAIRGSIPPELWDLDRLNHLDLSGLGLTGSLSPEIGNLSRLWLLDLSRNGLSGEIPPEIGELENLLILHLQNNAFQGQIPAIETNRSIGMFDLRNNRLTGELPDLTGMRHLQHLLVSGNLLTGELPDSLGEIRQLTTLDIAENRFTGELPASLGEAPWIEKLDLHGNAGLGGALPSNWAEREQVVAVTVRDTRVCAPHALKSWLRTNGLTHIPLCVAEETAFAYLVQAVQSRRYPTPLVAGEDALLRVFMTTDGEAEIPRVVATFYDEDGEVVDTADIPASDTPIPSEVDEGDLAKSANAVIPGKIIEPGLEMVIVIDPDSTLDDDLDIPRRIPAEGRAPVDVNEAPELDLTAIPFLYKDNPDSTVLERANELDSTRIFQRVHRLLPVGEVDVTVHESIVTTSNSAGHLLRETELVRVLEGGDGYYMGLFSHIRGGLIGVAYIGGWSFVTLARSFVLTHELGHAMNLRHAPCGGADLPDRNYPWAGGRTGSWGYDFDADATVPPGAADLMGYCFAGAWISPYHFNTALDHRLRTETQERRMEPEPVLIIWGGMDEDGQLYLEPAFFVEAPPTLSGAPDGEHRLVVRATGGDTLFSHRFDMPETAHLDGASSFVFAIPAPRGWDNAIGSIRLEGPGGTAVLDHETSRNTIILRDPVTGAVRAVLDAPPDSEWPGFDIVVSRGLPDAAVRRR